MKISVIMPVYNGEKTIERVIRSAMYNQGDVEVEMLVVDDGSTDRTPEILRELQTEIPNLHVARQPNMGPGAARNAALKQAKGDFVTFLDADDYFEPMALERMLKLMLNCRLGKGADACVAGTKYLVCGVPVSSSVECWHRLRKPVVDAQEDNFLVEITPGVRAKMFRRKILDGLTFATCKWEDLAFVPAALARAGQVAVLDEPVYNYRIHLNTTVKDFFVPCKVEDILISAEILKLNLQRSLLDNLHNVKYFDAYQSILTLNTVFRMQNVMTWCGVSRDEKQKTILDLANRLTERYPEWRNDAVLCDPEWSYKDPFFRFMLRRLYEKYLD